MRWKSRVQYLSGSQARNLLQRR